MKPIIKAITYPFKGSKIKKQKKQQNLQSHLDAPINPLQTNISIKKPIPQDSSKFKAVYEQVGKMIEHLGDMLSTGQKITEDQKRQLILELSSMAMNEENLQNHLFDEAVLDSDDDDKANSKISHKQPNKIQQPTKSTISGDLTRSTAYNKQVENIQNQQIPKKQLFQLFKNFEKEQKGNNYLDDNQNNSEVSNEKKVNPSSYSELKSKMSKFWMKNASKVLNLMKMNKSQSPSLSKKNSSLSKNQPQQQGQMPQLIENLKNSKKKKSFLGSIFFSWNGKKENNKDTTFPVEYLQECTVDGKNQQQQPSIQKKDEKHFNK